MDGIRCTADIEALERAPLPADLSGSTYELIDRAAKRFPDAAALSFFLTTEGYKRPITWDYTTLMGKINQTANFFRSLGVTRNETVAYVLPNLPETHLTIWGAQAAGRVAAFNPLLEGAALRDLIAATGATVLVTMAPFPGVDIWSKLKDEVARIPSLKHIVLVCLSDHVQGPKRLLAKGLAHKARFELHGLAGLRGAVPVSVGVHAFKASIARFSAKSLSFQDLPGPDDVSSCFCTGGTTGLPKVALRTHRNEVFNAWSTGLFMQNCITVGKAILCGLPLFHVNAVLVTGLLPFSRGAQVVLATPLGYRAPGLLKSFWAMVEHYRIAAFSGVPTLYSALLEVPLKGHNVKSLEYGLCGAAPMPPEVMRQFELRTGIRILEGYGLTEGTCVSAVNPAFGQSRAGSIGLRIPFQQMKAVVLGDDGQYLRDCEPGEVGQILIAGPNVFLGYSMPAQNEGIWVDCSDGLRWLNTGDLGKQDKDGFFFLTGRKKELIIRGGHNIDPKAIEDVLHTHPAVQMAAAVGRPDTHAGELPVAYVQLRNGQSASEAELLDYAASHITERAAVPKYIRVLPDMPVTGVGKIFKPELKRMETVSVVKALLDEASLAYQALAVVDDKSRGLLVQVSIQSPADNAAMHAVLGRLPVQYELVH